MICFLAENYESDQAPRLAGPNGKVIEEEALPVDLNLEILGFDDIDTIKMVFSVIMKVNVTWTDRRVDFLHLNDDIFLNSVSSELRSKLWIPEIGMANAKTGGLEKDEFRSILVSKDSQEEPFSTERALEDTVFRGHKNRLTFLRRYQAQYHCVFDLRLFPFDEQECLMVFRMRSATRKRVILNPGSLDYRGPRVMVEFVLEELVMQSGKNL